MKDQEERLQELLEKLEAGEPLAGVSAEAAPDEMALLQLASTLRELGAVERDSTVVAAQRAQVLQEASASQAVPVPGHDLAGKNRNRPTMAPGPWHALPPTSLQPVANLLQLLRGFLQRGMTWLQARPLVALGSTVFAVLVLTIVSANVDRTRAGDASVAVLPVPDDSAPAIREDRLASDEPAHDAIAALSHDTYLPVAAVPLVTAPGEAAVSRTVGVVEVTNEAGDWVAVENNTRVGAGQRVRTGAVSRASLTFYDGSTARLGPESEVSIDELHADPQGTRRILMTQWRGESEHEVAKVQGEDRTYRVDTPDGSGEAVGTAFIVRVIPGVQSLFSVLDGSINVTNINVTVVVVAGQLVVVNEGQPPDDPVFRITGEGEVTVMGDIWTIGGQDFAVDDDTIIAGEIAVGDYVFVDGHLTDEGTAVADRIVLISPAPDDTFALSGEVSATGATSWTVAGQTISVDDETTVEPGIGLGDVVRVEGRVLEDGELLATDIFLLDESLPFTFTGVVESKGTDTWVISGVTIEVNDETAVDPEIIVGDLVVASGYLEEGTWVATTITWVREQENGFSFTGVVDSIDPWRVAGISFETREWTVIDGEIEVGERVRVTGRILEDGTWVAASVLPLDEDALTITFVGIVDSIDPWRVGGLSLYVDDSTVADPEIEVGDLVLVRARRLAENEWLALLIVPVDDNESFVGCFTVTTQVVGWVDGELILEDWPSVDLGDDVDLDELVELGEAVTLDEGESIGEILDGSTVTVYICVLPDDSVVVLNIIIIFIIPDEVTPPPPPTDAGDKVTVCHKPGRNEHTLTIARPALSAHLGHGDYRGACR